MKPRSLTVARIRREGARVGDFFCWPSDRPWMIQRRILSVDADGDHIRITYEGLGGIGNPGAATVSLDAGGKA